MEQLDYLCIGHVTRDLTPDGWTIGGTATYGARTAHALGKRVAVVTSAEPSYSLSRALPDVPVALRPASTTTTFENIYSPLGRRQIVHSLADPLGPESIPTEWRSTQIVHLGPVIGEVTPDVIDLFEADVVGLTPQGWHRRWDGEGRVTYVRWPAASRVLPRATAVVVSLEDIDDEETWAEYRQNCRILVITNGAAGSEVLCHGERRFFSAPSMTEIDSTGVGDVFAAAFFIGLAEYDGDAWVAADFATQLAAPTVTRSGLQGIPTQAEIAAARSRLPAPLHQAA